MIEVHLEDISPIENAVNDVEQKTKERNAAQRSIRIEQRCICVSTDVLDLRLRLAESTYKWSWSKDSGTQFMIRYASTLSLKRWLTFHERLERYFQKEFPEEIRRLSVDTTQVSPSVSHGSLVCLVTWIASTSKKPSQSSTNTAVKTSFYPPPLQLGRQAVTPPPQSLRYDNSPVASPAGHHRVSRRLFKGISLTLQGPVSAVYRPALVTHKEAI